MKIRLVKKGEQPRGATLEIDEEMLENIAGIEISDGNAFYAISLKGAGGSGPSGAFETPESVVEVVEIGAQKVTKQNVRRFTMDLLKAMTWDEAQEYLGISKQTISAMRKGKITDQTLAKVNAAVAE